MFLLDKEMKKIKITEAQERLIKENDVVQYESGSSELKHFYSSITNSNNTTIDWESNNQQLANYDLAYQNGESSIDVDWSVGFRFDQNGFIFQPKINSVRGKLTFTSYDDGTQPIVIDISKYTVKTDKLKYSLDDYEDYSYHLSTVIVNIDHKTITF
jgi:hypothetical protein